MYNDDPKPVVTTEEEIVQAYKAIGVPEGTPFKEVHDVFRKQIKIYHSDKKTRDVALAKKLTSAYNILKAIDKAGRENGKGSSGTDKNSKDGMPATAEEAKKWKREAAEKAWKEEEKERAEKDKSEWEAKQRKERDKKYWQQKAKQTAGKAAARKMKIEIWIGIAVGFVFIYIAFTAYLRHVQEVQNKQEVSPVETPEYSNNNSGSDDQLNYFDQNSGKFIGKGISIDLPKKKEGSIEIITQDKLEKEKEVKYSFIVVKPYPWAKLYVNNEFIMNVPSGKRIKVLPGLYEFKLEFVTNKPIVRKLFIKEGQSLLFKTENGELKIYNN